MSRILLAAVLAGCGPKTAEGVWLGSCDLLYVALVGGQPVEVVVDYSFQLDISIDRHGTATALEVQRDDVEEAFVSQLVGSWFAPDLVLEGDPERYELVLSVDGDGLDGQWTLSQPELTGTGDCSLARDRR